MEEDKKLEKKENLSEEDLDEVTGGAILFDAYVAVKGIHRGKDKEKNTDGDKLEEKNGGAAGTGGGLTGEADEIKRRLNRFAGRK